MNDDEWKQFMRDSIRDLEQRLAAATARADENDRLYWELRGILDTQTARADAAEAKLERVCDKAQYVNHASDCDAFLGRPCSCYVDGLLKALEDKL